MQLVREAGLDLRPPGKTPLGYEPVEDPNMRKVLPMSPVKTVNDVPGTYPLKNGGRGIRIVFVTD